MHVWGLLVTLFGKWVLDEVFLKLSHAKDNSQAKEARNVYALQIYVGNVKV